MRQGLVAILLAFVIIVVVWLWLKPPPESRCSPSPWRAAVIGGCEYEGHIKNGKPEGSGIMYYRDGNVYVGSWKNGKRHGSGRLIHSDGSFDYGLWKDNCLLPCNEEYDYLDRIYGIDISKHNKMDWGCLDMYANEKGFVYGGTPKNKKHLRPISFVIMKATEGKTLVDKKYSARVGIVRRLRLKTGAYHFMTLSSAAKEQAEFFIKNVKREDGDFPPILDVEMKDKDIIAFGVKNMQRHLLEWLELVERYYGVKPMIYSNEHFFNRYLADSCFCSYQFWIAKYSNNAPVCNWKLWQFTETGHVKGVEGHFDINVLVGSYDDLWALK